MCGINGFNWSDENLIKKMNTKIAHRGPDDTGVFVSPNISLGHNRLSIIDLSVQAHQPMHSADGRYTIIYNGEMYNFEEIKKELSEFRFFSNSDTEVVLNAFIKWGTDALQKFNGIFSFAIWDKERQELFLARDQFGVKPLYYYFNNGKFIFSSEAKAILEHNFVKREINFDALNSYFRFLYVLGPETMWKGINKLSAGHFAVLRNNGLEVRKYFSLEEGGYIKNEDESKKMVRKNVSDAVKRQLISDRPVGLFLSGGLDSSILCAFMTQEFKQPLKTFSVGFETSIESDKFNADFNVAKQTARYFGTDHNPITISGRDVLENFENCVVSMDEPVSNHIQVATYLLAKEAKKQVAVVLGGDGGDETFGGYDRYFYMDRIYKLRKLFPFFKNKGLASLASKISGRKNLAEKLSFKNDLDLFLSFMAQKENIVERFLNKEFNDNASHKSKYGAHMGNWNDKVNQILKTDMETWLSDESLIRSDKLTMAHGLEQRVPLLDKELVELAFRTPSKYKLGSSTQGKKILKEAVGDLLPDFVLSQKKRGFFSPTAKWLRTDLRNMAYEILSPEYTAKTKDIFDWKAIRIILDNHMESKEYGLNTIWSLMTFQVWAKNYL